MTGENEEAQYWYRLAMRQQQKAEDNLRLAETRAMMITDLWHELKEARAEITAARAEIDKLRIGLSWHHCDTHGDIDPVAWGCPECVRELRQDIDRLTSRRAVKLCPTCERETSQEKYCEVWECSVCGQDNECEFKGVAQ